MKKIFLSLFAIMLLPFNVCAKTYINKNNIEVNEEEYRNLINLGFDENEIEVMSKDIYEKNKNLNSELKAVDQRYYKTVYYVSNNTTASFNPEDNIRSTTYEITKEEYDKADDNLSSEIVPFGSETVSTSYKTLKTTISKVNSSYYRLKNTLTWKKIPSTRSNDITAIGINNAVAEPMKDSQVAYTNYTLYNSCEDTRTYKTDNVTAQKNWKFAENGWGAIIPLPKDESKYYTWGLGGTKYPCTDYDDWKPAQGNLNIIVPVQELATTMYFDVASVNQNARPSALTAYGNYQHAQTTVSINGLSFSIQDNDPSISLDISIKNKYDGMAGTVAQLLNPWQ